MKRGDLVHDDSAYGLPWIGIVLNKKCDVVYRNNFDGSDCQLWWVFFGKGQIVDVSESALKVIS